MTPTNTKRNNKLLIPSLQLKQELKEQKNSWDISPQMVEGVMGNDVQVQIDCTAQFRRLLSTIDRSNRHIKDVIETGVVPRFVEFLGRDDNPGLQFEAAWALTNIASGTSENTQTVIQDGAVPILCRLLSSPNYDVREQAVWALANIAGDSPHCRDQVLQAGAMMPLLSQLNNPQSKLTMLRNATWALSNFFRGKPKPNFDLVKPSLPTLAQLILNQDEEVVMDSCWALSFLSDGPKEMIQTVIDSDVYHHVVKLLLHHSPTVQTPALKIVGNIASIGSNLQKQFIINYNTLPSLLTLLLSPKKSIRKEACWAISNITAGNEEQIHAVIEANIIPSLMQLWANSESLDVREETARAISSATSGGNAEQIKLLVSHGCIGPLYDLLEAVDPKLVIIALEGLENILKVGDQESKMTGQRNFMAPYIAEADVLKKIEDLQQHYSSDVYEKCIKISEIYIGEPID